MFAVSGKLVTICCAINGLGNTIPPILIFQYLLVDIHVGIVVPENGINSSLSLLGEFYFSCYFYQ